MKKIFYGIGGGDMRHANMAIHYPRIVELAREQAGREGVRVSILPTAHLNGTNKKMGRGWMDFIVEQFERLGCEVCNIFIGDLLPDQKPVSNKEVVTILDNSDAVFVLGGDTQYLLEVVRDRELVKPFLDAYERGTVFAGSSAGLIWFSKYCMSDSESFHEDAWNYIMLEGLGVLPLAVNVHDNGTVPEGIIDRRSRREQFEERFLEIVDTPGLAVDEMVGIEVVEGICKVRTADRSIGAEILINEGGVVRRKKMDGAVEIDLLDTEGLKSFVFE
ncbi:MAG: Type 1 glutamine amidotransferase-like domain-containing protein [Acidobacteriota bacterium]|nr:Type 1 glutamine amidotransferase-like domain-containing protein [Acidobacteriota bacterium]MDH3528597.1 Type 1 glutamine amidotransferase-like domain-containing protein [Acidobacteriota bacterium]